MTQKEIANKLAENGMRVTLQRIVIFEAIIKLDNHPTAEHIIEYVKAVHPNISTGTIYKVLEVFVEKDLLKKVKTDNGIMRYDPFLSKHHHLHCSQTDKIADYEDPKLDSMLQNYFKNKKIKNFKIQDIKLQITGHFKN